MNDDDLITVVKESVTNVHMNVPAEQIISRSRALRARRQIPVLAATLTGAAAVALAVTALLPPNQQPEARLAAWTVAKGADGDIDVTINQLHNPAGLQSALRADGLPVNVRFSGDSPIASCRPYPSGQDVLRAAVQISTSDSNPYLIINPSALPADTGLAIFDQPEFTAPIPAPSLPLPRSQAAKTWPGLYTLRHFEFKNSPGQAPEVRALMIGVVYASQSCTG